MLKFIRRLIKNESGQAMVELAVTLPALLLVLCGIIDFGWFFSNQLTLSYCSREGARYGIVHARDADATQKITDRVLEIAPDFIKSKLTVSVTFSDSDTHTLGDVIVQTRAGVESLTPVTGIFAKGEIIELSSQTVMKVE